MTGASFGRYGVQGTGITKEQLYSTASYQAKNLQGIGLGGNNLAGWDLSGQSLTNASLYSSTLRNANLTGANLTGAQLNESTLTGANLTGANLTNARLDYSTLTQANLSGAVVTGAYFGRYDGQGTGITKEQLYSTASYQAKNLQGIGLVNYRLTGWDLSGQNLTNAQLDFSTLTNADLTGANLTSADLGNSRLTNANLTGAVVTGASFGRYDGQGTGITKEQLYSTASYQAKNLQGIGLRSNNLSGWDFSGQNLTNARLDRSTLTNANLTGVNLTNARLDYSTLTQANLTGAAVAGASFGRYDGPGTGIAKEQLYSTASYQAKNLQRIGLEGNDLTGWDFSGQNLTNADLDYSTLTQANLTGAVVTGASFVNTTSGGFTKQQLYSTASYQRKNLRGTFWDGNDLTAWDFSGQDMTDANFFDEDNDEYIPSPNLSNANFSGANLSQAFLSDSTLTDANLIGTNLRNANLEEVQGLRDAAFDYTTVYNQWTRFPIFFSPARMRLTLSSSHSGDFSADDVHDAVDVDMLASEIRDPDRWFWLYSMFDLDGDGSVGDRDHRIWVKDVKHTWYGDADLDGEFNSDDFVQVFQAGKYEREPILDSHGDIVNPVSWAEGDWNADGIFDSRDMVTAFVDGGYELEPRTDVAAVPEPAAWTLLVIGFVLWLFSRRTCAT